VISLLAAVAPALPLGKAGKFVAGAYIVFIVVILLYVAIMAVRAQRIERELDQLQRDVEAARSRRSAEEDAAPAPAESGSLL
jgi:CcmD family protein